MYLVYEISGHSIFLDQMQDILKRFQSGGERAIKATPDLGIVVKYFFVLTHH